MIKHPCQYCGRREVSATSARKWCRFCETCVTCEQCGLRHGAPPDVGLCERCRHLNAIELRAFYAAAELIAGLDLARLGGRVVYPFRVPLSNLEAARLARAARALQLAMRDQKGLKRAELSTQEGVKQCRRSRR